MIRLLVVLIVFLVPSAVQAVRVDADNTEYCDAANNTGNPNNNLINCISPAAYLEKTLTRLYFCTSQPDISNLSTNCVDSGIEETELALNLGETVELNGSRLPLGTYTHALVLYELDTKYRSYIETPVDVTPIQGWVGSGTGVGKYCWGVPGFRTDRAGNQSNADCGPVLPNPLPLAEQKQGLQGTDCSWFMGPIVGTRDGSGNTTASSLSADMAWLNSRLNGGLSNQYESCGLFSSSDAFWQDKDDVGKEWKATLFSDFENRLGQAGLLSSTQINQRYLDATEGYKNREWHNASVKATFGSSSLNLELAGSESDLTHTMGIWTLENPVTVGSSTLGVDYKINFTRNVFFTVQCGSDPCYLNTLGFIALTIKPVPY